jgi:4-amino-4-deoxy-L-arabinose transferase-like glycosyltransferase
MASRTVTVLLALLLAGSGAWLYLTRLGDVPAYLMHDEVQGALQAHAIATTGRDLSGRLLPLYFTEPEFPPGRDPVLVYVTAAGLKLLPFTEWGTRAPTALMAVLNVVLMFVAARSLFQSTAIGLVAALMLLLTPVHFIRGRLLLSPLYTLPFILGWLWALARFEARPGPRRLAAAAGWLALGAYSYLAAVVMMPVYLLLTLAIGYRSHGARAVRWAVATFAMVLVPMVLWYATHPERNAQIVSAYQLDDANAQLPIARWIRSYWAFFDPSFLFVSGDASLINSTREAGFYPAAFAVLMPIGLYGLLKTRQPLPLVIVAGLLTAPLVSVISGAIEMNRVMFAIPFGVLTAAYGSFVLLRGGPWLQRAAGVALVAAIPWQFAGFYSGYLGGYRLTSAPWFAGNAREGLLELMTQAEGATGPIYLSVEIEWVHRTWRFYAIQSGRLHLADRATYFREPPADAAPGAVLICPADSPICRALPAAGWNPLATVPTLDGSRAFTVLRRAAPGA